MSRRRKAVNVCSRPLAARCWNISELSSAQPADGFPILARPCSGETPPPRTPLPSSAIYHQSLLHLRLIITKELADLEPDKGDSDAK